MADHCWSYTRGVITSYSIHYTKLYDHTNVLQHLLGYLKDNLDSAHRTDLANTIDAYRRGEYPLVVPLRLLQHHFSIHPHPYISEQVYLNPHPQALKLRNTL